jgi:serine/threonine protein kinase/WD40 repeat protein
MLTPAPDEGATVDTDAADSWPKDLAPAISLQDYELLGEIARGGMGIVYRARQTSLNRTVALKMVLGPQLAGEAAARRFRAEAEAAASLDHPNIVPIYEVGEHDGRLFYTMKLVENGSLASRVKPVARPRDAAVMIVTIARAVHYAHQRGILHRDLKPANILLDAQEQPHVTDFGLARRLESDSSLTLHGAALGTPNYMPPEQARAGSAPLTVAADVYSLGAILYELLCGQPPFQAATPLETMRLVIDEEPVPPSSVRNSRRPRESNPGTRASATKEALDDDLETICLKCLEKDPARRYGSAEALADDLDRWLSGEPILARPAGPGERALKWIKRHPALAALIGVSGAGIVGVVVMQSINDVKLKRERDHARHQERRATTNELFARAEAQRAESNAITARLNLYAADIYVAAEFVETGQVAPALALLKNHEPALGDSDVRGFEWYWLRSRCEGDSAQILRAHSRSIHTLAFSPDGQRMASGDHGEIVLWDTAQWQLKQKFPSQADRSVWEAKGQQGIALMERDPAKMLQLLTGRTSLETEIAPSRPDMAHATTSLGFAPDGRILLSSGRDEYLKFWELRPGRLRNWYAVKGAEAAFLPDGRVAAFGEKNARGRKVEIVDAATGKVAQSLTADCTALALSANREWLATLAENREVIVWNARTLKEAARFRTSDPVSGRLAISPDGQRVAAAIYDREMARIFDVSKGGRQSDCGRLGSQVLSLSFSPDGKQLALGMRDSTVRLHDGVTGAAQRRFSGHLGEVFAVAWSPAGELISAGQDCVIRIWNRTEPRAPMATSDRFFSAIASPESDQLAGVGDHNRIVLWDGRSAKTRELNSRGGFQPLAFRPTESALLVGQRGEQNESKIELWRLADGETLRSVTAPASGRFHTDPKGDRVVICNKDEAVVFDAANGRELARFSEGRSHFLPDHALFDGERFICRVFPYGAGVWTVSSGQRVAKMRSPEDTAPHSITATRDGALIITGDDDYRIRLWDGRDGRLLRTLTGHGGSIRELALSPDERTLASVGDDLLMKLWSVPTGRELMTLARSTDIGRALFLPNGRGLVATHPWRGANVWRAGD